MSMTISRSDEYQNSVYTFENGDGTKYHVHVMPAQYGGLYVIVNENSLWRWHGEGDLKFLCGNNNEYTKIAAIQIMQHHDERMFQFATDVEK